MQQVHGIKVLLKETIVTMDSVYAVIVTFNGIKWIDKCFLSLLNSSISIKIIVIDNGSSDMTSEYIKSNFPTIELIETGKNLGFGQANNISSTACPPSNSSIRKPNSVACAGR